MFKKDFFDKAVISFIGVIGWVPVYFLTPFVMLASLRNGATGDGYYWPVILMIALACVVFSFSINRASLALG